MAHLTLQLGGSVVVPFGAPWGASEARRERVSVRRLRWKALSEAAAVAESAEAVFCAVRIAHPRTQHPFLIRAAPHPCQGGLE